MPARSPFEKAPTIRRIASVPTMGALRERAREMVDDLADDDITPVGLSNLCGYAVREVMPAAVECLFLVATTDGLADREVAFEDVDMLTPGQIAAQVVSEAVTEALAEHVRRRKGGQ